MNLIRFMSTRELYRFLDGETISGNTEWRREGYASSSKGICFFPADPKPETRLHYLSGVVSFQRVVEFAPCGDLPGIRMAKGRYRDPKSDLGFGSVIRMMEVDEVCMPKYNYRMLYPLRIGTINIKRIFNGDFVWEIDWMEPDEMKVLRGHTWDKRHTRKERMA